MQINTDTMENYLPIQGGLALVPFVAAKLLFPQIEAVFQVALIVFAVTGTGTLLAGLCRIDLDDKFGIDEESLVDDFMDRLSLSTIMHAALALVTALYFGPLAALQYTALTLASFPLMLLAYDPANNLIWLDGCRKNATCAAAEPSTYRAQPANCAEGGGEATYAAPAAGQEFGDFPDE